MENTVFVGRITRGLAIDCFRKKHAAKRPDTHRADVCSEMDELSLSYTIEEQMAEKKLLEEIEKFLWKLPEADRDIFIRRYWYLDPICEIAKRYKVSAGCIKTNLCRNRKKLFRILEQEGRITFAGELSSAGLPSIECDWMELRLYHYWAVSEEEQGFREA